MALIGRPSRRGAIVHRWNEFREPDFEKDASAPQVFRVCFDGRNLY